VERIIMTTIICLMEKGYLTIDIKIGTTKIIVLKYNGIL